MIRATAVIPRSERPGRETSVDAERPARRSGAKPFLTGAAVGAGLAWLLDPDQGHRRRRLLADRVAAAARRSSRRSVRALRVAAGRAEGRARGFLHRLRPPVAGEPADDATLAHKVESVVFRDRRFPKGQISVNAEEGEVFLRGEVDEPDLIRDLEEAVRRVPGVRGVENLLHLPGTPAPASHTGRRANRS
jgi:hypothetical protein